MIELPKRLRLFTLGIGLLATGLFIADAQARLPLRPGAQANGRKGAAGANFQQAHQLVLELQSAKHLLERAKHDYDGHRVKAIHEINQAIHAIHQHHGKGAGTKAAGKNGGGGGQGGISAAAASKETQKHSDALLRQARQQLHTIHGQMQATHHPKAKGLVHAAVVHLDTALKIR